MEKHDTEIELKFLVSRHLPLKQVRAEFAEQLSAFGFVMTKQPRHKLSDIYFDNASSDLQRSGWTLRCRYTDADNVCVTLKSIIGANATFRRLEYEEILPIDAVKVDQVLIMPGNSRTNEILLNHNLPTQDLLPVLKQTTKRTTYTLSHPSEDDTEVQWCIDKVKIRGRRDTTALQTYTEFELELIDGRDRLLQHLNLIAHRCEGLSASRMSKFMRGRYAHDPKTSWFEASPPADCDSQNPYNFRSRLKHLIQNEPFAYEALHPEGVHQLRISTRKLRASLNLLHRQVPGDFAAQLEADLKKLTGRLGKVRDLDVHRDQLGPFLRREEWQNYLTYLNKSTHKQQIRMRKTLDKSFSKTVGELDMFSVYDFKDTPAEHFAADAADIIIHRIHATIQSINGATDAKRLHKCRIELKKLRYQLTTYATEYEQAAQCLHRMKAILTLLGNIQDAEMAQERISVYLRGKPKAEKRHFKSFLRKQRRLSAEHQAALAQACGAFEVPAAKVS